ncbi:MAG: hypothetical protein AAB944_00100 [Patescibacteria group bacterium]
MFQTGKNVDKTAHGIFLFVVLVYMFFFWQILRTLWPTIVCKWNFLIGMISKALSGGCDMACTVSLLSPSMTLGGLLLVTGIVLIFFLWTINLFQRLTRGYLTSS